MSLLGWPLVALLGTMVVALPVATFLLWSRAPGRRPVRAAFRLGLLAAGQVATVLLVAALANDYGYFYTSWGDLVGATGGPSIITVGQGQPSTAGLNAPVGRGGVQVLGDLGWSSPAQWSTRGRIESVNITGRRSGLSAHAYVYLPPEYFRAQDRHTAFPAVEVLTGYPGSDLTLVERMHYPDVALAEARAHRARPMVYVFMRSAVAPPRDTECTDVPGGPQAETYLAQDVPSAVDGMTRVLANDWGAMGDSTGGYCATKILMDHPTVFRAGVSLSGYYHPIEDITTGDLWGGSATLRSLNDPEWLLAHEPAPPVSLLATIGGGERGRYGYPDTMRFVKLVRPPMRVQAEVLPDGGHNLTSWDREMPHAIDWLSQRLTAAR